LLALAIFAWILARESSGRTSRKNSAVANFKNHAFVDGGDRGLSGDRGSFCQRSAFSARRRRSSQNSINHFADAT
jgi:hypothetical protein